MQVVELGMANKSLKLRQNVPGTFYVTEECVDCDRCREMAPEVFTRDDAIAYSVVARQPATEEERQRAVEALEQCPVEAIGMDG